MPGPRRIQAAAGWLATLLVAAGCAGNAPDVTTSPQPGTTRTATASQPGTAGSVASPQPGTAAPVGSPTPGAPRETASITEAGTPQPPPTAGATLGDEPTLAPGTAGARAGSGCPPAPPGSSSGPASTVTALQLALPPTAKPGGEVTVSATIAVAADAQRIVLRPQRSGIAVLRGDAVVAWAAGEGYDVPLTLTAGSNRPAQVLPAVLRLVDCAGKPLPAGAYEVRAVVGYGGDPLDAGAAGGTGDFRLVSNPVGLTVG